MDDGADAFVVDWLRRNLPSGALTDDDRAAVEDGIRGCYVADGREPPRTIVWAPNPAVASKLAATAAEILLTPSGWFGRSRLFGRSRASEKRWWQARNLLQATQQELYFAAAQQHEWRLSTVDKRRLAVMKALTGPLWPLDWASSYVDVRREAFEPGLRRLVGESRADVAERHNAGPRGLHGDELTAGLEWALLYGGMQVPPAGRTGIESWIAAGRVIWWAHPRFAVASEPPAERHLESLPAGRYRWHRADGPALAWYADAAAPAWKYDVVIGFLHGVGVPMDLITDGWPVERIHAEPNSEIQRAAIERMGWLRYLAEAGLELVASCPDPANPPHTLELYDDPGGRLGNARILVMTNGSPDRSGRELRYAEPVPRRLDDPVEAAAWQYDVPVATYRAMSRHT